MVRTQILLEEAQYRWATTQARRWQQSLSQVLRGLIDAQRTRSVRNRREDPLFRLIGLGRDPARDVAEEHDRYLYGAPSRRSR
jgi:hypothetical protein